MNDWIDFALWVLIVLLLGAIGIGVLFAMNALGILPPEPWSGFVGMGLGVLALFGAIAMVEL